MKTKKPKKQSEMSPKVGTRFHSPDGGYIEKMPNGFYKAFRNDGTEMTGVTLPINTALMALRRMLPYCVKYCPSLEEIEMEPGLQVMRDDFLSQSPF